MTAGYKVNYLLICDDIRKEASGKEILIGVYNDAIIVPNFPASLPSIHFRISVKLSKIDFKSMNFSVKGPDGNELMSTSGLLPQQSTEESTIIEIGVRSPIFPRSGEYSVFLGLDREPKEIGSIILRLPKTDEERKRGEGST